MEEYLPFDEALAAARSLRLDNEEAWNTWCTRADRPPRVPSRPDTVYDGKGWKGWAHWLGTTYTRSPPLSDPFAARQFLPFNEALSIARSLELDSVQEWQAFVKEGLRPKGMPAEPHDYYKQHGWKGWGHFLGTGNTANMGSANRTRGQPTNFLSFKDALSVARSLKLTGEKEWRAWSKAGLRPANVPAAPNVVYKNKGWIGWPHWLGNSESRKDKYLSFTNALTVARSLGLNTAADWRGLSRKGMRPLNVPSHPDQFYAHDGWQSWGHWLGTGNMQPATSTTRTAGAYTGEVNTGNKQHKRGKTSNFLPFADALVKARSLGLTTQSEWRKWSRDKLRPPNIPANPAVVYVFDGWESWGHWLGTGSVQHSRRNTPYLPFDEAMMVVRAAGPKTMREYREWGKAGNRPLNIPAGPDTVYKHDGWQDWGHFLGTGNTAGKSVKEILLPFEEALEYARSLQLTSRHEWQAWSKKGLRPTNVPSNPQASYNKDGWQGWGHWLGTGNQLAKDFLPFKEAAALAQSLGLANQTEWFAWSRNGMRPANVPADPRKTYANDGWQGWRHWLGTGNTKPGDVEIMPFNEALTAARSLELTSKRLWRTNWSSIETRFANMPPHPQITYKDIGWEGWGHWLGNDNKLANEFMPVKDAMIVHRNLWHKHEAKRRAPTTDNFEGTRNGFLPFEEALVVARSLGLASSTEWLKLARQGALPANVPFDPFKAYKTKGWEGWGHFLGTGNVKTGSEQFLPFEEARDVARSLRLATRGQWMSMGKMRPANVPSNPNRTYEHEGWESWGDFLGTGNTKGRHVSGSHAESHPPVNVDMRTPGELLDAVSSESDDEELV